MPQLVSSDGEIFELSELAAQQSVTLVNIRADAGDDAPIPVPLLDKSALTKITALLERTAEMTLHSAGGGGTVMLITAQFVEHGLPRGAALDDERREAIVSSALDELDINGVMIAARRLGDLKFFDAKLPETILAERVAQLPLRASRRMSCGSSFALPTT